MTSSTADLASVLGRALSGSLSVSEHDTDQRIMDAVAAELLVTPLRKLSLEDVAGRAGVTRMTVYRRFGDREHLIEATFAREVSRFIGGAAAVGDPAGGPAARLADAFGAATQPAPAHPPAGHRPTSAP